MENEGNYTSKKSGDAIFYKQKTPSEMPPYNWYELGGIKNVPEDKLVEYCNKPIYQILPVKYLIKILLHHRLRFNNILYKWEDPYELFFLKHIFRVNGDTSLSELMAKEIKSYYGQCWSFLRDSDAMWRIYSHDKEGVRIKTSVIKMIHVVEQMRGILYATSTFGKVDYLTNDKINDWINKKKEEGSGAIIQSLSESLFIKRTEFEHEQEIRFLLNVPSNAESKIEANINDNHVDLQIDPFNFIEEITIDPRLSDEDFNDRKQVLSFITKNIPINKSDLYTFQSKNYEIEKSPIRIGIIYHNK